MATLTTTDPILFLQNEFSLSYHINYLFQCAEMVGIEGKKVLEVGGSLPEKLVCNVFKAAQWYGIEEETYWNKLNNDKKLGGYYRPEMKGKERLKELNAWPDDKPHDVFLGRIEDLGSQLYGHFDLVFSIACFEHIHDLGYALDKMYGALKPGGKLFAMFSPIWSSFDGHHLPNIIENGVDISEQVKRHIPDWGHLYMSPPEMYIHLKNDGFKPEIAAKAVNYIYHNSHINRLKTEDYLAYVKMSPFKKSIINLTFLSEITPEMQAKLEKANPRYKHFRNNGLLFVLEK
jgi:SAM-dependent methyltransferase